jgi:hypothetical protein
MDLWIPSVTMKGTGELRHPTFTTKFSCQIYYENPLTYVIPCTLAKFSF